MIIWRDLLSPMWTAFVQPSPAPALCYCQIQAALPLLLFYFLNVFPILTSKIIPQCKTNQAKPRLCFLRSTHSWSVTSTCPSTHRWAVGTPAAPGGASAPSPGRSPSGRWARRGPRPGSPAAWTPAPAATGPAGPPAGCSLEGKIKIQILFCDV